MTIQYTGNAYECAEDSQHQILIWLRKKERPDNVINGIPESGEDPYNAKVRLSMFNNSFG